MKRREGGNLVTAKPLTAAQRELRNAKRRNNKPVGRPSVYRKEMCQRAVELGKEGKTWTAIANHLGITRETIYAWIDTKPEFSYAMNLSRAMAMEWWEKTLQGQALGEIPGGSATAAIFAMKNQFPDDYKDRREVDHSGELKVVEVSFLGYDDAIDAEYEEVM